jgi:transposase
MKKIVKQVLGVDVSQKELVVSLGRMYEDFTPDLYASKVFANTEKGFNLLLKWIQNLVDSTVPVRYVMEATGIYHESFAYFLDDLKQDVSIVLPNKMSNYMRTLDVKTVTDKTAAEGIARFGLERKLDNWHRPKDIYRKLKQLTRERDQLVFERTMIKNQLHAEESGAMPLQGSITRLKDRINLINRQEAGIKQEIELLIEADIEVKHVVELICSIPGISILSAAIILSETNGFELIRNRRQLASYAGFDVKEKESGTSVKKKPKISKQGNRNLRKAMHLPALSAIKHNERFKAIYAKLVAKHGIKMKAAVAVQRKLLELVYTVYKTKTKYEKNYVAKRQVIAEKTDENNSRKQLMTTSLTRLE